ncbi:AMP-binding protein [Paraglaciecola aestuariivivens]
MPSLLERLQSLPKTGVISCAGKNVRVEELMLRAGEVRQQHPQLEGQSIALNYTNLVEFISAIMAFDGWCSALYLCPLKVHPAQIDSIKWPLENNNLGPIIANVTSYDLTSESSSWFLATSGTTGQPKWYSHSFEALTASTKYSEQLQSLNWGLLYQPFRYAGLQVVLQALLSGADLVDAAEVEPLELMAILKQNNVSAISATPSLWRQLLMTGQLSELSLRYLTLGGEIADQSVLDKLKALFPKAKLRHIYASTEAGVGLIVSDGLAGFPLKWLDDKKRAVGLKISNEQNLMVKPKFNLSQNLALQTDSQGYLDTQDKVEIVGDRVRFIGRATGTINVGGNKVQPEKVEQVLLQSADVLQAKVYAKKSALMGELVVADVIVTSNAAEQQVKAQLLKLSKEQLQRFEIPTKINLVQQIKHDPSGKLNRK